MEKALSTQLRGYTRPQFYEATVELEASEESADFYTIFGKIENLQPISAVSETLGIDAGLIGIKVGAKGVRPNDDEWMDIEIVPSPLKKSNVLYISLILRTPKKPSKP